MARKPKPAPKPARRKPGTGTIRNKSGRAEPWEAEWKHANGSSEYRGFSSRAAAETWLDGLVADRESGRDLISAAQPFSEFIQAWLEIKRPHIEQSTYHTYKYYCEVASGEGGLGPRRLDSIILDTLQKMINHLHKEGFVNLTQLCNPLKQAFRYAARNHYIKESPMEGLELPKTKHKKIVVLTQQQRAKMLQVAAQMDDPAVPLLPLWHLASRLGWRKGEAIALRWASVDLDAGTALIQESVTNVGADVIRGETKTKRTRVNPLPPDLIDLLCAHKAAQRQRAINTPAWIERGLVFTDEAGDEVTPQHVQYRWSLLRKAAGCPAVTIHGLRHTALYLLALDGVPENVRKALAGHESKQMAEHYSSHASVDDIRRHIA